MKKRFLALFMALIMTMSLLPTAIFAEEAENLPDTLEEQTLEEPEEKLTAAPNGGNDWKLTLLNSAYDGLHLDNTAQSLEGKPGDTVEIAFSGAKTGEKDYVSVVLVNDDGDVLAYGRMSQGEESGTLRVTIPTDLKQGDYTLKVFNEQYNGDYRTDYAGKAAEASLTVKEAEGKDVYVFFQTVKSDGTPLSKTEGGQAFRDRLHFVYNLDGGDGWATLGILKSKEVNKITARTASPEELKAVENELRANDPEKFTRLPANENLSWQVIDQMDGVELKIGNGTSGSYGYLSNIWKMDLQLKCYHVAFDANAGDDVIAGVPNDGYYIEGESIVLPVLKRDRYVFAGWKITNSKTGAELGSVGDAEHTADWSVGTADLKIIAQWEKAPTNVYVYAKTVKKGGGTVYDVPGVTYNRSGYATLGKMVVRLDSLWEWEPDDTGASQAAFDEVVKELNEGRTFSRHASNKNIPLSMVRWAELIAHDGDHDGYKGEDGNEDDGKCFAHHLDGVITVYEVKFDANMEGVTVPAAACYLGGASVEVKPLTHDGYTFVGWKITDSDSAGALGSLAANAESYTVGDANVTLTAQWEADRTPLQPGDTTVRYIVEHYRADENGKYPDTPTDREILGGKDGEIVTAAPKSYPGYHLNAAISKRTGTLKKVTSDADIVILKLYYDVDRSDSRDNDGTLVIRKTDANDGSKLTGAYFTVYKQSGSKWVEECTIRTTNGYASTGLDNGKYYVVETMAPAGYTLDETEHSFTISNNTVTLELTNDKTATPAALNDSDHFAYIIGYEDGTVQPSGNITRAEVATIFFRLLTDEVRDEYMSTSNPFSDVKSTAWYNRAVSTLYQLDILKGSNDGKFHPQDTITRAEFAAIAARFSDKKVSGSTPFTDLAGHWAKDEVTAAASLGWVNGYTDGTFRPNQPITRAEAMTLVNRVLNRSPKSVDDLLDNMVKWPDNMDTAKWYYLAVQEATNSHDYKASGSSESWTKLTKAPDWTRYEV